MNGKTLFLTAVLLIGVLMPVSSGAETIAKGSFVLSAGNLVSFMVSNSGDLHSDLESDYGLNPDTAMDLHYFVYKGLALGGVIAYSMEKRDVGSETSTKTTIFDLGPSVYYYFDLKKKIFPFIGVKYLQRSIGLDSTGFTGTSYRTSFVTDAGVNILLNEIIGLTFSYTFSSDSVEDGYDGTMHTINSGLKIFF